MFWFRRVKAVHQKEKFWQCESCDYKTNNQVCYKKHKQSKHEGGGDCDLQYSVEVRNKCIVGQLTRTVLIRFMTPSFNSVLLSLLSVQIRRTSPENWEGSVK